MTLNERISASEIGEICLEEDIETKKLASTEHHSAYTSVNGSGYKIIMLVLLTSMFFRGDLPTNLTLDVGEE